MKPRAVDFVSYGVTDMDRSEAFYRDVLGLEVEVARGKPGTRASGYMELDAGGKCLPLVNLHLHFSSRVQRLKQMERLLEWLREKHHLHKSNWAMPPIICGDFNNPGTRDDATASLLSHLSHYCDYALHPAMGLTFPSPLPRRALDFIFLPAGCTVSSGRTYRMSYTVGTDGRTGRLGAITPPDAPSCLQAALEAWVGSFRYAPLAHPEAITADWMLVTASRGSCRTRFT